MSSSPTIVQIEYLEDNQGALTILGNATETSIWAKLKTYLRSKDVENEITQNGFKLSWSIMLDIVRELGNKSNQRQFDFRFEAIGIAKEKIQDFIRQYAKVKEIRNNDTLTLDQSEIEQKLESVGFTKRKLKSFQIRDLSHLLHLNNGANFSVPGAGKTTVTFALHMLVRKPDHHFIVIAPKSAFQAWIDIVDECISPNAPNNGIEPFTKLEGTVSQISKSLKSGATRFLISYDLAFRRQECLKSHFVTKGTHLVLDESHRIKSGWQSQRGSFILEISNSPVRRDILTGTPMPQSVSDLATQLDFLWPGYGLGTELSQAKSPREVLGNLYVRTTKEELQLPKVNRKFVEIGMEKNQLAIYSIVRSEFLRDYAKTMFSTKSSRQFLRARRSVIRLLQLSANPVLALRAILSGEMEVSTVITDQILEAGHSSKMRAVMEHARSLSKKGEKCVIWTIFTDTIEKLTSSLADLNPVFIHGGVPTGDSDDLESREGRIKRFHEDENCWVLIANPAATSEGISLHMVCHNAIYLDRNYVSTQYLQSIDRIHRLGMDPKKETRITIYQSLAPKSVGSIDISVSNRLRIKIDRMKELLEDKDLREIALDEEQSLKDTEYDMELEDIADLISELNSHSNQDMVT